MADLRDEFEVYLKAIPDWALENEVNRPWVEKLMRDAWNTATERAAKKERELEAQVVWAMNHMGHCTTQTDFCSHVLQRGGTGDFSDCASFIAAAIRAREGKGGAG